MSGHFIERCSCGVVLSQCRCPGPRVERVSNVPCTHATPPRSELADQLEALMLDAQDAAIMEEPLEVGDYLRLARRVADALPALLAERKELLRRSDEIHAQSIYWMRKACAAWDERDALKEKLAAAERVVEAVRDASCCDRDGMPLPETEALVAAYYALPSS